jgi:hypothetical protein
MDIQKIIAELRAEMGRISEAIGSLEGNAETKARVGRPPGSAAVNRTPKRWWSDSSRSPESYRTQ